MRDFFSPRRSPEESASSIPVNSSTENLRNARPLQQIGPQEIVQILPDTVPKALLPILQAMGLCNNCDVRVCQSNGTCILDVGGSRVGISDQVATSVQAIPVA